MADHQAFDPFTAIRPGNYFSHYLIEAEVGSGTFARVYRARDLQLDRPVALKVFKPDCPVTPSAALAEARAAAALNHPNLCTIYAVDDTAGVPIIAMEYISGRPVSQHSGGDRLPIDSLHSIALQIAAGMASAHAAGIVHGDLKPENVMVTEEGVVKVLDFGLARRLRRIRRSQPTKRPSWASPSRGTASSARPGSSPRSRSAVSRLLSPAMCSPWGSSSSSSRPERWPSPAPTCSRSSTRSARSSPSLWRRRPPTVRLSVAAVADPRPGPGARSRCGRSPRALIEAVPRRGGRAALARRSARGGLRRFSVGSGSLPAPTRPGPR